MAPNWLLGVAANVPRAGQPSSQLKRLPGIGTWLRLMPCGQGREQIGCRPGPQRAALNSLPQRRAVTFYVAHLLIRANIFAARLSVVVLNSGRNVCCSRKK